MKVLLRSSEFEEDEFHYDGWAETVAGVKRLVRNAARQTKKDGIEREVVLVIDG